MFGEGKHMKRDNRIKPGDNGQYTFCLCDKCGEAYEAAYEHICRKKNSYPMKSEEPKNDRP